MDFGHSFIIVSSDPLVRAGLAARIESQPDCEVLGLANPIELFTNMDITLQDAGRSVLIWDWGLESSDSTTIDFGEVDIPVILLLSDNVEIDELLTVGASAMISRDASGAEILATSMAVSQGKFVLDREFVQAILPLRPQKADDIKEPPTPREQQVLQLMAEGYTNKAIANNLGISEHTVKFHINSIFGKLQARSRTEAVVQATRLGLISL